MKKIFYFSIAALLLAGCNEKDDLKDETVDVPEDEWYAGGKLGTVFNATSYAYEQPTDAVTGAG
ncbi:MAG: membrane lipoprotein lipid attachment site-containing protein, partial [Tannerella sp.]|nr:membrane lipoprotein lipid attachment site-containing protein [Tannerella sp.]